MGSSIVIYVPHHCKMVIMGKTVSGGRGVCISKVSTLFFCKPNNVLKKKMKSTCLEICVTTCILHN